MFPTFVGLQNVQVPMPHDAAGNHPVQMRHTIAAFMKLTKCVYADSSLPLVYPGPRVVLLAMTGPMLALSAVSL